MPSSHDELPMLPGEPQDVGCAGCPICGSGQSGEGPDCTAPEDAETGMGTTVLAPMGLFLFPVVTAMLGALWGAVAAFGQLLGAGLVAMLALQTLLNVGGVTKAIPLTGITLPFLSQGGSSLVAALVMVGLLAAISDGRKGGT